MSNTVNKPLISVLVPIYNKENYLKRALDSIISQEYTNLEIILLDDGSSDDSYKICEKYAKKDSRIKLFHQDNQGVSVARNKLLEYATGNYVSFIDADDIILANYYSYLYDLIYKNDADISECKLLRIDNAEEYMKNDILTENINSKDTIKVLSTMESVNRIFSVNSQFYVNTVILCNKLFKKDIFDGIKFPEGKINEDEYITFLTLLKANKLVTSDKILYLYLQSNNSIMRRGITDQRIYDAINSQLNYIYYFKENTNQYLELKSKRKMLYTTMRIAQRLQAGEGVDNSNEAISYVYNMFKSTYESDINSIKEIADTEELEVIKRLDDFYNSIK